MKILLTGGSGLIGSALIGALHSKKYTLHSLQRNPDQNDGPFWDDVFFKENNKADSSFDTVIHLAGENVTKGRWSKNTKERILKSRIDGTRELINNLSKLKNPPRNFICASAVGYYGSRGDESLNENSSQGSGFLADVCRQWEGVASHAKKFGARVVNLRFGMVLSPHGGALQKMVPPFKAGLGATLGNGKQYVSWISIADLTEAVDFILQNDSIKGPVNIVSPKAVTNRQLTKSLAKALGKSAKLPAPAFALRLIMGEMADEMLLASTKAEPELLLNSGFTFQDTDLDKTLEHYFHP